MKQVISFNNQKVNVDKKRMSSQYTSLTKVIKRYKHVYFSPGVYMSNRTLLNRHHRNNIIHFTTTTLCRDEKDDHHHDDPYNDDEHLSLVGKDLSEQEEDEYHTVVSMDVNINQDINDTTKVNEAVEDADEEHADINMLPKAMAKELDKYIIGQDDAKKAISIAFRNRWRCLQLPKQIREEITPKNILMVGSTGVGKTEISRRVSNLTGAPFIKVEATQYTEVGFRGKDVNSIIEQLVQVAIRMEKEDFDFTEEEKPKFIQGKDGNTMTIISMNKSDDSTQKEIINNAIKKVEEKGIVFIDEIDKVCRSGFYSGSDASDEGVQRDLLPLIEGTQVTTKYGEVRTDNILFIAAGAFSKSKPSDLISELRGRLPIRVTLNSLTQNDIYRILTEPVNNIIRQNIELFKTEQVDLRFTDESLVKLAEYAAIMNEKIEDIGARRLFSVTEAILEDYSYKTKQLTGKTIVIDRDYVTEILSKHLENSDQKRYIL